MTIAIECNKLKPSGPVTMDCWACGRRLAGHVAVGALGLVAVESNVGGTKIA